MLTPQVHHEILEDVQNRISVASIELERLTTELDRLKAVEEYHTQRLRALAPKAPTEPPLVPKVPPSPPGQPTFVGLNGESTTGMNHADVCELILAKNNRRMRTIDMARIAQQAGYGSSADERHLGNAFYTAMTRKVETFNKTEGQFGLNAWN